MKLLHYTSLRNLLFASLLTLISIPVFYILLNNIFVNSIDRDLRMQAAQLPSTLSIIKTEADLRLWQQLDNDLEIKPLDSVQYRDQPFTIEKKPTQQATLEDFRVLQKRVEIMGKPYVVGIESSLFEKEDLIQAILIIQFGILLLLLAGTVAINYMIHKRIWRPFYQTLAYLKSFNIESDSSQQPQPPKILEFKELSHSIQQLSIRVRQAFYSQKEFIENASHELQTPLTVLKFKLELLLQDNALSGKQGTLIADMYREIDQMQQLNSHLLLLSKIENRQFASEETFDVQELIVEVTDELALLVQAKNQKLQQVYCQQRVVLVGANRTLFKIMVGNLLTNAIQYSASGSIIVINLWSNALQMSNPGMPLGIEPDKIFKRFVRHNQQKGNGLGLSIVQTIASYHGYNITYDYREGNHQFKIIWTA